MIDFQRNDFVGKIRIIFFGGVEAIESYSKQILPPILTLTPGKKMTILAPLVLVVLLGSFRMQPGC